ncbi:MAG: glycosyltransferase family 8 protein [Treponemataceae bacterium]|nr:MAG: glycosyltransferase family 8 protein [Treponemataceae bacterium]
MFHISLCIDNNYAMQCGVVIKSVLLTHKDVPFTFHILSADLSDTNKQKLCFTCQTDGHTAAIAFYKIDFSLIQNAPIAENDYLSLASYFRLFLSKLLPPSIKKTLYLDADVLVLDSLLPLLQIGIADYAMAAGIDAGCNDVRHLNRLELPFGTDYFNAGVLLINLEYWREHKFFEQFLDFIANHRSQCKQHDQDVLNKLLHKKILPFSARYNYLDLFFCDIHELIIRREFHADIADSTEHIVVMHYAGGEKPWHYECMHPHKNLWSQMQQKTLWAKCKKTHKYRGKQFIVKSFRRTLEKLGLIQPHVMYVKT